MLAQDLRAVGVNCERDAEGMIGVGVRLGWREMKARKRKQTESTERRESDIIMFLRLSKGQTHVTRRVWRRQRRAQRAAACDESGRGRRRSDWLKLWRRGARTQVNETRRDRVKSDQNNTNSWREQAGTRAGDGR